MKKYIIVLLCSPLFSVSQTGSIWIENQNIITKESYKPVLKLQGTYIPKKTFGVTAFLLVNPDWAEGFVGFDIKPTLKKLDVFEWSLCGGIEQDSIPIRIQTTVFLKKKFFSTINVFEYGGSGYWYLHTALFRIYSDSASKSEVRVGWHAERFVGIGPRIELVREIRYCFLLSRL